MIYQPVALSPLALAGDPVALPLEFVGLTDAALADFSAAIDPPPAGYAGKGLWPLVVSVPTFDPATEVGTGDIDLATRVIDKKARIVTAIYGKRALTAEEIAALNPVPDNPTLSDWRVAMTLWGRLDDLSSKVNALVSSATPAQAVMGKIAKERLEYANNVLRAQLLQLGPVFGFSESDIDESLWRADRVRQGDLSGAWPLPAA